MHFLMVIALLPTLALPVLAGMLARERLNQAATVVAVIDFTRLVTQGVSQLSSFLSQAAHDSVAVAQADAAGARRHATLSLAGAGAVVILTAVALWTIGGALRKRLNILTQGAARLSDGRLEPLTVQGPRELAATARALNAAVATLQHVQTKAELLVRGELDSPEREQRAPGPLAAAVDASMSRIVTAVRERAETQLRLAHEASHDVLTGLPNRAELNRALQASVSRAARGATAVSVLFIDLDGFKACNDQFGHAAGDHILCVISERLQAAARNSPVGATSAKVE